MSKIQDIARNVFKSLYYSSAFWIALGHHPSQPPHHPPPPKKKKKFNTYFFILSNFLPIIKNKMRINAHALYQQGQGKIYIINGCSLGHFYKKNIFTNIGYSLGHFYKKKFLTNIGRSLGHFYK